MAYTKVHTPGIVLAAHNVGEADRLFSIFTRDLGLLYARGRGVRNLSSLQRYALQPLSVVDLSVVRSRGGWRVTNVSSRDSLFALCGDDRARRLFVTRILALLKRLVTGEEMNEDLFAVISNALTFLFTETLSADELQTLEAVTVLRTLHFLGYLKQTKFFPETLLDTKEFSKQLLLDMKGKRREAIVEINRALHESQL